MRKALFPSFALALFVAACADEEPAAPMAVAPATNSASIITTPPSEGLPAAPRPVAAPDELQPNELEGPSADDLPRFTRGIEGRGTLFANIVTNHGTVRCELFEDAAPRTVANFVGLARGLQPWLDPDTKRVVRGKRFYDGLFFHRVIPGFVIQGGAPKGDNTLGPGYKFDDENLEGSKYSEAGVLGMANAGPNTNGSQFFVSLGRYPHLDRKFTVFGHCDDAVPHQIAKVEVESQSWSERSRPASPVVIQTIRFSRGEPAEGQSQP